MKSFYIPIFIEDTPLIENWFTGAFPNVESNPFESPANELAAAPTAKPFALLKSPALDIFMLICVSMMPLVLFELAKYWFVSLR